ncbi:VIT1/CCC1 transporter family protein [Alicyclobacillus sp. SO9]|uniref:VIT1/CCC1 transporter family protein n=1 Tax=Alicyclobacillus sp. SO9 TaxID=2665646 RepID=UPI0018E6F182|nr:VIT1/CCC1 transporter family protein [Alicyclobacillus sp. SO9]QQE78626.1 VIT1/CCC1 transporter family protein [Alicyclobacillus sp. SO9]
MNSNNPEYLKKTLIENWRKEMEAARLYQLSADSESDDRRSNIFQQLADLENKHVKMWEDKLSELGVDLTSLEPPEVNIKDLSQGQVFERIEAVETNNMNWYQSLRNVMDDEAVVRIIDEINEDEKKHGSLDDMLQPETKQVKRRLNSLWGKERWHKRESGGWVGDAIYGVNDGLGAIFGIIAGVAGFAHNDQTILISGFFGALASTLSMGAGAWLAAKSENEILESELSHERREIQEDPEHEVEELKLLYELKGLSPEESNRIATQVSKDQENFLNTMAQEELGIHEASKSNPWSSALFGSASTFVGAIVPLLPFFFLHGWVAMVTAAAVSIVAHFVVGALKSIITVRGWLVSGLEMTLVGIMVGAVSYGLGELGTLIFGVHI